MHPEEIRYSLHRVVPRGVGADHCGFGVAMFNLVIVQRLCQWAALRAGYLADGGILHYARPQRIKHNIARQLPAGSCPFRR